MNNTTKIVLTILFVSMVFSTTIVFSIEKVISYKKELASEKANKLIECMRGADLLYSTEWDLAYKAIKGDKADEFYSYVSLPMQIAERIEKKMISDKDRCALLYK